jgi:hypothetical protein
MPTCRSLPITLSPEKGLKASIQIETGKVKSTVQNMTGDLSRQ